MSARCAERDSSQGLVQFNVVRVPVVLNVIPFGAFSTLCGANARYAGVVPVSVVQPSAAARVASAPSVHASVRLSIGARAQPARAADAAARRTRSRLFSRLVSATMFVRSISGGAANAQPVGRFPSTTYRLGTCYNHRSSFSPKLAPWQKKVGTGLCRINHEASITHLLIVCCLP